MILFCSCHCHPCSSAREADDAAFGVSGTANNPDVAWSKRCKTAKPCCVAYKECGNIKKNIFNCTRKKKVNVKNGKFGTAKKLIPFKSIFLIYYFVFLKVCELWQLLGHSGVQRHSVLAVAVDHHVRLFVHHQEMFTLMDNLKRI